MATVAADDFTGTDGTTIVGRTMTGTGGGAVWALGPTGTVGNVTISGNQAIGTNFTSAVDKAGTIANADGFVQVDYNTLNTSSDGAGVCARIDTGGANTYYRFLKNGTIGWILQKVVLGTSSSLGTFTQIIAGSTLYVLKMTLSGSTITCYVNGTSVISVTDTSITAAGNWGIRTGSVNIKLDNFIADNGIAGGTSKAPYYYRMAA